MQHIPSFEDFLNEASSKSAKFKKDYYKGISKSTAAKKVAQMNKQADMPDDDPSAYKELPGDTKGKKLQKVSQHTSAYHDKFSKDEDYVWEAADEQALLEGDDDNKKSTDRTPIDDEKVEVGLKNKSEETGVPMGILRAVMRRGMAAWKSGHRPGIGQTQWSYARVNSFLTKGKGTWGKGDSDLAQEVKDAGKDSKL